MSSIFLTFLKLQPVVRVNRTVFGLAGGDEKNLSGWLPMLAMLWRCVALFGLRAGTVYW